MSGVIAPHDPHNLYIPGASPLDQDLQPCIWIYEITGCIREYFDSPQPMGIG